MSEDMVDDDLESKLSKANAESAKRKRQLRNQVNENNALKEELEQLRKDKETLAAKLEKKPDELRIELEAAKGKLRQITHKSAFDRVAKSLGANETALDDLFAVSGYKADSDEADESAIRANLEAVLANKPYFKASVPSKEEKVDPAVFQAGLGLSRGSTSTPTTGFQIRESEIGSLYSNPTKLDEYLRAFNDKTLKVLPG